MLARVSAIMLAVNLVALTGCGPAKLDVTKTIEIAAGETNSIDLDAQPHAQTITVDFDATPSIVNIGVFKEADAKDLSAVHFGQAIKATERQNRGTLVAEVPEKTAVRVVLVSNVKASVKVHITNKK